MQFFQYTSIQQTKIRDILMYRPLACVSILPSLSVGSFGFDFSLWSVLIILSRKFSPFSEINLKKSEFSI